MVTDEEDPAGIMARFRAALAPGSFLALSHTTFTGKSRDQLDAGATLLKATRAALAAVPVYYQRLAEHTRGHGISVDDAIEERIPADRGLPGHGGPLPLPG